LGTVSINADSGDSSATDTFADYAKVQRALPYPLCSDNLGYDPGNTRKPFGGLNGKWDGTVSPVENISAFSIPKCNGNQTSVPNAVRIHNGATINKSVFPDGLTIGTNLPGYILGDLNTSSDVDADWVPFLFAADAITGVSNNWKDDRAPWEDGHSNVSGYKPSMKRPAMDTRWRAAMFFGHVWPTTKHGTGAGLQNWVRFIEDWDLPAPGKKTCIIDGSLVVGFSSVFENQSFWSGGIAYKQPWREFRFDEKFNSFSNQPPGAPTFSVIAVKDWKRN
ncbi:MAG: hypothetical protein GY822_28260, partial [Deltaproteobacteria bacterium]|nr:hypothetical protein [Deltaproteobacteria bacterium]